MSTETKNVDDHRWRILDVSAAFILSGSLIQMHENEHEFLWINYPPSNPTGIYIFNTNINEWKLLMNLPQELKGSATEKPMYDHDTNSIYIRYGRGYRYKLLQINLKTQQSSIINEYTFADMGTSINTPNEIHTMSSVGGSHYIYNKLLKNTRFFHGQHIADRQARNKQFTDMIYIPNEDAILLLGGLKGDGVHKFCLKQRIWIEIKGIDFPYYNIQSLLTWDQKHIVLGGICAEDKNLKDEIWILDILGDNQYKLRKSRISLPCKNGKIFDRQIILGGNRKIEELIVYGFIKTNYNDIDNVHIFNDVVGLMISYYSAESLHCLRIFWNEKREHSVIPIYEIL